MKKTLKNALVITLVAGLCLSFSGIVAAVDPSYEEIIVSPAEPPRLSEVSFSVDVTGENIEEVRVIVEECTAQICYPDLRNESMTNTQGNTWEGTVTLIHDDAIYCTTWLVIKSDGTWYNFKDLRKEFNLSIDTGNGDTNGGDGNGGDGAPGFELILLVISLVLALFIYKKKRRR
ncbi:MAG: hypothetical protein JSW60_01090 [Thermoplasmatales archaeon]|nr:MAG: hypothetical protein JSW60_01090 [Thermoplasmatales archaeon]